jgi:uncharacterized membrane protein YtjA (UPF0391 family)
MMVLISGIIGFGPMGGAYGYVAKTLMLIFLTGFGLSLGFIKRGSSIV